MIKFLKRIGRKSHTDNNVGSFFLYAFGEIFLVVIGILIALKVNNHNEVNKLNDKIIECLLEIHQDLSNDIKESDILIQNYRLQDSIINIIMSGELSVDDYKGDDWYMYFGAGNSYYDLKINDNGFQVLMSNSSNIPKEYHELLKGLKKIYINDKDGLERSLILSENEIEQYLSNLAQNKNWYFEVLYNQNLTDEAIDYFLNDPQYKNHLTQYDLISIGNYYQNLYHFRMDAEEVYQELTDILERENALPTLSNHYKINARDYDYFAGTYKDSLNTTTISIKSNKLYFQLNGNEKTRLFPISSYSFIQGDDEGFNTIQLDSMGKVSSIRWQYGRTKFLMKKVD